MTPRIPRLDRRGRVPKGPRLPVPLHPAAPPREEARRARDGWPAQRRGGGHGFGRSRSRAHEAPAVSGRAARLRLGGPEGEAVAVAAGDALVRPSSARHGLLEADPGLGVVGAYPSGEGWGIRREAPDADVPPRVAGVALRGAADPMTGADGPCPASEGRPPMARTALAPPKRGPDGARGRP